ncbi:DUF4185 domain-containing protein [Streptomyces sp. T12]|uniref:DUF4185 domain-containing protein n=3 Tax=unclassified Streptomyces TaxID=2593676 RepID=UPI0023655D2F|nr:DUF4185 domain-containing protein [Streptomyces sp. T12]WDF36343.1 DUF4185 domain-containing protein [Streptomyces sp. T12]
MWQAPMIVQQFHWSDQPRTGNDAAMREIFLSSARHSLGRYWSECTFGIVDAVTGAQVDAIRSIGLTHDTYFDANGDLQSRRTRDETIAAAVAAAPGHLAQPGPKLVFMFDNPSPAGASGTYAVLDFAGSHSYMAHEIGHALGFDHSFAGAVEYGNPYCIMSALTFGGANPTHTRPRPADSAVPQTVLASDMRFWERFGPMPAGATLFNTLPDFHTSGRVRRVALGESVRLRALSEAGQGETVLAVVEVDRIQWTAELRVATRWDAGLALPDGPGEAVVLHGLLPAPGGELRANYQGRIPVVRSGPTIGASEATPEHVLPNGSRPNLRLIVESFDPVANAAQIRFEARPRPTVRALERLGPTSVIQADFGAGDHKNFEACVLEGDELWHWWRDNSLPWQPWTRGQLIASGAAFPGALIQSDFGSGDHGNFEVVVPIRMADGTCRLRHFWHDNGDVTNLWQAGQWVTAAGQDVAGAAALLQSDFGSDDHGNFEVVVPLRQPDGTLRLAHFWHDNSSVDQPWRHAAWITPEHQGVSGPAAFIQSDFTTGDHGNFEVVVPFPRPQGGVGLRQFWSDNSSGTLVWRSPEAEGGVSLDILHGIGDVVGGPSLVQSDFGSGDHGNFELVVPVRYTNGAVVLWHIWRDSADLAQWQLSGQYVTESCRGTATLFRSSYGAGDHRNFEVLVEEDRGSVVHYWHPNDDVNHPWLRSVCVDMIDEVAALRPPAVRIAQLTGEHDRTGWDGTGEPPFALNRTESRFSITGTDLGVPFEHGGRTFVLFGDTWRGSFSGDTDNLDAIAVVDGGTPDEGLRLDFRREPPRVPGISQGGFEVPLDGVSWGGAIYGFFSTDHYQAQGRDVMGRSVLARSDDDGRTFNYLYDLPRTHFINVSTSIVDGEAHGLPAGPHLVVFGSARYRSSDVYLAVKPAAAIGTPGGWRYFAGTDGWSDLEGSAAPLFPAGNVGELSVRWSPAAQHWLAFWNENDGAGRHRILMRAGARPQGPWTEPVVVFDVRDGYGGFIHQTGRDHTQHTFGDADNTWGDVYGPYQFERYTRREGTNLRVYFSMSVWNPYQSMLMRTELPLFTFAFSLRSASREAAAAGQAEQARLFGARADSLSLDLATVSADEALHHHVTGYTLLWGGGDPVEAGVELARQREAAGRAMELAGPMAQALPDPNLAASDVLRLATLLWRLIGLSTHGSADMAPGIRAAELARRSYEALAGDHRIDVVQVWTDLAQRHHETGYWFGHWAGHPDLGTAELTRQREAAAAGARLANEVAAELPVPSLGRERLSQLLTLLERLAGTVSQPGMVTHGLPPGDPHAPELESLAATARTSAERVRDALAELP